MTSTTLNVPHHECLAGNIFTVLLKEIVKLVLFTGPLPACTKVKPIYVGREPGNKASMKTVTVYTCTIV